MKLQSTLSLTLVVTVWVAIHVSFSPAVLAGHKGKPHGGGGGKDDGNDPVAGSWDVTLSGDDIYMATRRTGCVGTTVAVRKTAINMPFLMDTVPECFNDVEFGGVLAIVKAKGKKPDLVTMFFNGYRLDLYRMSRLHPIGGSHEGSCRRKPRGSPVPARRRRRAGRTPLDRQHLRAQLSVPWRQ